MPVIVAWHPFTRLHTGSLDSINSRSGQAIGDKPYLVWIWQVVINFRNEITTAAGTG